MDNQERINSLQVAVESAAEGVLPTIWTALPAILQSFDADAMTCEAQPSIMVNVSSKDGKTKTPTKLPLCVDVPVQFIGGGGFTLTFPMKQGDEGLLVFACRCIDAWWQSGGVQPQADIRMHDLSDGFFIPGFRSQARKLADISTSNTQLRSDDGTMYVDLDTTGTMTLKAPTKVVIDSPLTHLTGALTVDGNATIDSKSFIAHEHGGVTTGLAVTGPPV